MTVQNRVRSVVAVTMLVTAFFVFAPSGEEKPDSESESQTTAAVDPRLEMHGASDDAPSSSQANKSLPPAESQFFEDLQPANRRSRDLEMGGQLDGLNPIRDRSLTAQPTSTGRSYAANALIPIDSPEHDEDRSRFVDTVRHRIQPGETLQSISIKYFGHPHEYLTIYELNQAKLGRPIDLPPGLSIEIPVPRN